MEGLIYGAAYLLGIVVLWACTVGTRRWGT